MKPLALLLSGYILLLSAWVLSNPPGAAPDEYAHYLKALAAGRGELLSEKRQGPLVEADRNKLFLQWMHRQTRMVEVDGGFSPDRFNCPRDLDTGSWLCPSQPPVAKGTLELRSWVGTYPPFTYVLPGIFMQLGSESISALIWGRAGFALQAALLLALAAWALWDPKKPGMALLGLTAAVTPMVIFVGSSLSASGTEVAAGICFGAGLMSLARSERPPRASWLALGAGGVMLALSRDLGIIWVALGLAILAGIEGPRKILDLAKAGRAKAAATAALLGVALLVAAVWQIKVQVRPSVPFLGYIMAFKDSLPVTKEIARQEIGVFGPLNTVMPAAAYVIWAVILATLGVLAMWLGTWRERLVLAAAVLAAVALPVGLDVAQRSVAFGVQGRHVLPFTVLVPLVAGEIVFRREGQLRWLEKVRPSVLFSAAATFVYLIAWYINAKSHMVGPDGPVVFWRGLRSVPPLGWVPLGLMAGLGCLAMFVSGWMASVPSETQPSREGPSHPAR